MPLRVHSIVKSGTGLCFSEVVVCSGQAHSVECGVCG